MDDTTAPTTETLSSDVQTLFTVEQSIRERMNDIDMVRQKLKEHKEMLDSILMGNQAYVDAANAAKKATQVKSSAKQAALKDPSARDLNERIASMREEVKELQDSLSYNLREYQRMTGLSEFEDQDGEVREIVYVAKLVKRSMFHK